MFAHYTKESELPSEDIISDKNHNITINTDYSIFNLNNIPEQLAHIPYSDLKIIFDYLGTDGKVHTQRELSKKYNMSLGIISNLLSKRIKEICNIYKLPPPDRFKSKNQKDNK